MEEEDESNGWVPHTYEEEDVKRGDSGTILILKFQCHDYK